MFVGRKNELKTIRDAIAKGKKSLLVYGKRKVGKTTLVLEASKAYDGRVIYFECLKATLSTNLEALSSLLLREGITPIKIGFSSFLDLFIYLSSQQEKFFLVIDEYPYLKTVEDGDYVDSLFQNIIDHGFPNVFLAILGSHLGMMKDLLNEKNALYGRFACVIFLKELDYLEASNFYKGKNSYEKVAFYGVFGGSPFALEQIDDSRNLKENVVSLLLDQTSALYLYCEHLLMSDISSASQMNGIFACLANGRKKYGEIEGAVSLKSDGLLSKRLSKLLEMEMISKRFPINKKDDKKRTYYELSDNLLRFYYAYIYPHKSSLPILGGEAFYEAYIQESIKHFISYRFEDIVKNYFSIQIRNGNYKRAKDVGVYYYDDPKNRKNGEFDVAIKVGEKYEVYEAKYLERPLSIMEMHKEISQVNCIEGLEVSRLGFVSVNGFEEILPDTVCLSGDDIYEE